MSVLLSYVALVADSPAVRISELNQVAAALQKQALRDLEPVWNVRAAIDVFARLEDVPLGYWPIVILDDLGPMGPSGLHTDKDGQPFALIDYRAGWSLAASHEFLEMVTDPYGNRLIAGPSAKEDQGRVEYLMEVADPCEDPAFAYTINGVIVSDFYTDRFFDPVVGPGVRYSYTGAVTRPREVLKGGYLTWHDLVTDHWWQLDFFEAERRFKDLGVIERTAQSIRATVDRMTPQPVVGGPLAPPTAVPEVARAITEGIDQATGAKAAGWRAQIETLKAGGAS